MILRSTRDRGWILAGFTAQEGSELLQLVLAALERIGERSGVQTLSAWCYEQLTDHADYIRVNGQDMPQTLNWR